MSSRRLDLLSQGRHDLIVVRRRRAAQRARILTHLRAAMIHSRGRWM